jgi:iron complex transport system substrate-binding protein
VIGSVPFRAEALAKLLDHPLRFLAINPRTIADIFEDIRLISRLVHREQSGERLILRMQREFEQLRVRGSSNQQPGKIRVYCEAWPNPRITSPPWVGELVELCGGQMALPAGQRVAEAEVAEARPGVIILAWAATGAKADPRRVYAISAWKDLPAVRNRRVFVIRDELLNTPGPPLIEGARRLFRLIHNAPGVRR